MNRLDRPSPLERPPAELINDKAIRQAADAHERLVTEHAAVRARHYDLVNSRWQAAERDRDAYATAIADGKDDPGQEHTRQHDAQITDAARREEALEVAVSRARQTFVAAVERRKEPVLASARDREEKERVALLEAVEQVAEHLHKLAEARHLKTWVEKVSEEGHARWRPGDGGHLPGVKGGPSGEPVLVGQVVEALRSLCESPQTTDQRTWTAA